MKHEGDGDGTRRPEPGHPRPTAPGSQEAHDPDDRDSIRHPEPQPAPAPDLGTAQDPRARDLFADRRFALLFAARTISVLAASFGPVALAFGVLELPGADATTLTVVLTAQTVPQILFMLFGGVIADRVSRFRLLMGAELLSAAAFASLAAMFVTGHAPVAVVAAVAGLTGVALALYYPALTGVVPDVVPEDRLQTANGVLRLGVNSARLLGMALAGGAVALVGPGWALALNAGGLLAAVAALLPLRHAATARRADPTSMLGDLREGWREFAARRWLWVIVLQFSFVVAAMQAAFGVLGPVVAKEHLGGAPAWSAILAAQGLGTLVGVFFSIRIRPRRPLFVATSMVFAVVLPITLLGLGAPVYAVAAGAFVTGMAFDVFGVLWETTMQREIPREALSRVSAYDGLGSFMFGPLGLIAAAPLAGAVGPRTALLFAAGLIAAATLAALAVPEVRGLRAPRRPTRTVAADPGSAPTGGPTADGAPVPAVAAQP